MLTPESAIGWARMIAGKRANEDDVKRIAGALMRAERDGHEAAAMAAAADEVALTLRRIETMAENARAAGP